MEHLQNAVVIQKVILKGVAAFTMQQLIGIAVVLAAFYVVHM